MKQNSVNPAHLIIIFLLIFLFLSPIKIYAESDYVLPYPSVMPGSKLYKINQIKDSVLRYWYFGDFAKFKYNLKKSDKHLVEAKILFEYKQYLLGSESLKKSDYYFRQSLEALRETSEIKNKSENEKLLKSAAAKHIEEIEKIKKSLPDEFLWTPEKGNSVNINFIQILDASKEIRNE